MPVEERRRLALRDHVVASWGEEAAETLFELVTPAGHELATRQHLHEFEQRVDARFSALEERIEGRFAAMEERADAREHRMTAAFERRIADAVTAQTRTLVFSQLGAVVTIAALAFGLR
jgi:hypothetical protein